MIGIFDSGSGGLTVLKAIREVFPSPDVVYFGDIKNAPYGSKSQEELLELTINALMLLQTRGVGSIVSACNSVSASLAVSLYDTLEISTDRLIEMVGPTVGHFKNSNERILLCATEATIRSRIYQNGFRLIGKTIEALPIPALAGAIEFGSPKEEIERIIAEALVHIPASAFDTLILGCTHYPLVSDIFSKTLEGKNIKLFDPAEAVAFRVAQKFWPREMGDGRTLFLISKDSAYFRELIERLFPYSTGSVEVLDS